MRELCLGLLWLLGCAAPVAKPDAAKAPASAAPPARVHAATTPIDPSICESDPRIAEADGRYRNGKALEAQGLLKAVLEDDPQCPGAYARLGRLALERGAANEAEGFLRKALDAAPEFNASWHGWLAETSLSLGRPADAVVAYQAAVDVSPTDDELGLALADVLLSEGRFEEAVVVARGVADRNEGAIRSNDLGPCTAWCLLGEGLAGQEKHAEAMLAFRRATSVYQSHRRAWAGLALSAEVAGQSEQAVEAWEFYVRLDCCSERSKTLAQPRLEALRRRK